MSEPPPTACGGAGKDAVPRSVPALQSVGSSDAGGGVELVQYRSRTAKPRSTAHLQTRRWDRSPPRRSVRRSARNLGSRSKTCSSSKTSLQRKHAWHAQSRRTVGECGGRVAVGMLAWDRRRSTGHLDLARGSPRNYNGGRNVCLTSVGWLCYAAPTRS